VARRLGGFLRALQRLDVRDGPPPASHSGWRGGPLDTYDDETRRSIRLLGAGLDEAAVTRTWERALATRWQRPPVWVHGDMAASNLLVRDGDLVAVIDFGCCAVGDPACDLVVAWTMFDRVARATFRSVVGLDDGTWERARGWAL
jgi:aminoglycoside phosphotransferase (APT) family kinase protein